MSMIFEPTMNAETAKRVTKARRINATRDEHDRHGGSTPPGECPLDAHARTVIEALVSGMNGGNWGIVAEGIAMLQDLEVRLRG